MNKRPLADLIAEQNRLAKAKAPDRPSTVVIVLVDGRYNGPDFKSQRAKVGDVIAVAGGAYANDLIASGLVELPVVEEEQEPTEEPTVDLESLTVAELRDMAHNAGISTSGLRKAELIEALSNGVSDR